MFYGRQGKKSKKMNKVLFIILYIFLPSFLCAQNVFKTPSGNRYHLSNCRTVKNVSQEITKAEARKIGLTPCAVCKPENIYAGTEPVVHKAKGEGTSVQCRGLTKAKKRCLHMTKIGNGFCFQHQPG